MICDWVRQYSFVIINFPFDENLLCSNLQCNTQMIICSGGVTKQPRGSRTASQDRSTRVRSNESAIQTPQGTWRGMMGSPLRQLHPALPCIISHAVCLLLPLQSEIAAELDKLSSKLDDVDKMISLAMAEDPQVQSLLSSTSDVWMPVITATAAQRRDFAGTSDEGGQEEPTDLQSNQSDFCFPLLRSILSSYSDGSTVRLPLDYYDSNKLFIVSCYQYWPINQIVKELHLGGVQLWF